MYSHTVDTVIIQAGTFEDPVSHFVFYCILVGFVVAVCMCCIFNYNPEQRSVLKSLLLIYSNQICHPRGHVNTFSGYLLDWMKKWYTISNCKTVTKFWGCWANCFKAKSFCTCTNHDYRERLLWHKPSDYATFPSWHEVSYSVIAFDCIVCYSIILCMYRLGIMSNLFVTWDNTGKLSALITLSNLKWSIVSVTSSINRNSICLKGMASSVKQQALNTFCVVQFWRNIHQIDYISDYFPPHLFFPPFHRTFTVGVGRRDKLRSSAVPS